MRSDLRGGLLSFLALAALPLLALAPGARAAIVAAGGEELLVPALPVGDSLAGWSVAISGDTAVIGAPYDDDAGVDAGAAWVFVRVGTIWVEQQKLFSNDLEPAGDQMGTTVAIDGDVIALGAPGDDSTIVDFDTGEIVSTGLDEGSVLIFRRSGDEWVQTQLLHYPELAFANFGATLALDAGQLAIGLGSEPYVLKPVYRFGDAAGTFVAQGMVTPAYQSFGEHLALDGSTLAVADRGTNGQMLTTVYDGYGIFWPGVGLSPLPYGQTTVSPESIAIDGDTLVTSWWDPLSPVTAVHTRTGTTWSAASFFPNPNAHMVGQVAIEGDVVVVGDTHYPGVPALRVFRRSGSSWPEGSPLAGDRFLVDRLGHAVAMDGGMLIAGAPDADAASVFDLVDGQVLPRFGTPGFFDFYGRAIAVDGATAVVGVPGADGFAGAAVVYRRDATGWTAVQRLVAADRQSGDAFGQSVAISADTIIVGAPQKTSTKGAAYVFRRSGGTFTQRAQLLDSTPQTNSGFGISVAATGDWVFVGAPNNGPYGIVRVYRRSGSAWPEYDELGPELPSGSGTRFGTAVAAASDLLLVGAPGDDEEATDGGAVTPFFYTSPSWIAAAKFTPSLVGNNDQFGAALATDGSRAVIGAPTASAAGADSGRAWIFARSGSSLVEQAMLLGSHTSAGDEFGTSVSISGNAVAIGAPGDEGHVAPGGAVSVFVASGSAWNERHAIEAWDGLAWDGFGIAVALGGDTVLAGAFGGHEAGALAGRSYAIDFTVTHDCSDGIDDDADGATDFPADPGCTSASDTSERGTTVCDDGLDSDADGLVDFPNDPGCASRTAAIENPKCDDDVDNDGDGTMDWDGGGALGTPDSVCVNRPSYDAEAMRSSCGVGAEIAPALAALALARRRRAQWRARNPVS